MAPTYIFNLITSWLAIGIIVSLCIFFQIKPSLHFLLLIPLIMLFLVSKQLKKITDLPKGDKLLLSVIGAVWLLHSLGILTPETGFDSLWYHLPVLKTILEKGLFFSPNLYQSVNPLFSDFLFLPGLQLAGNFGTKTVAYLLGLSLIFVTYALSRLLLNRNWSLINVLIVSTFQVITWQSSSFYVDVAKAFWEVSTLYLLLLLQQKIKNQSFHINDSWSLIALSGACLGASVATKVFSILLVPFFLCILLLLLKNISVKEKLFAVVQFVTAMLIVATPFYWNSYHFTGNMFYSITVHLEKLHEIGGQSSLITYVFERIINVPFSLSALFFTRDYTSPLLVLLLPFIFIYYKTIKKNDVLIFLSVFSFYQLLLWWFIPPLSTRYALAGFITLLILEIKLLTEWLKTHNKYKKYILIGMLVITCIMFIPRLFVTVRALPYITGKQTQTEYLQHFYDGNVDRHIETWYRNN